MTIKHIKHILVASMLLALCGGWAGCSKKVTDPGQAFSQAAPEIKTAWEQSVASDKANDYVPAITGYQNLAMQRDKLTQEQSMAVGEALLAVNQRLQVAFKQGDPAARAAWGKLFQVKK